MFGSSNQSTETPVPAGAFLAGGIDFSDQCAIANYSNRTATTCNYSVALHALRMLVPLPQEGGDKLVQELAASFATHGHASGKVAPPLIEYSKSHGAVVPKAPLLTGWDPAMYQDPSDCWQMLLQQIEEGLQGTQQEGLVRALFEGVQTGRVCRDCGHHSCEVREFRSVELGGPGLDTNVASLFASYWSTPRQIDGGKQTVRCDVCDGNVRGSQSYHLLRAPPVLLVTMSRRDDTTGVLSGRIELNERLEVESDAFELCAVFVRQGVSHYYAYLRSSSGHVLRVDDMAESWQAEHIGGAEWARRLQALADATSEQATAILYARCEPPLPRVDATAVEEPPAPVQPLFRARVEEAMGRRVEHWPKHYQKAANAPLIGWDAKKHDSGAGRHALCLFCIHNGCPPDLFLEWLKARNCVKSESWQEFKSTLVKLEAGKNCGNAWELQKNKSVPARMPDATKKAVSRALELLEEWATGTANKGLAAAPEGCKAYYGPGGLFPARDALRLLHRKGSPVQLREISINSRTLRSRPVLSFQTLAEEVLNENNKTASLHVGPAFDADTQAMRLAEGPLGTEMVLEIDELPPGIPESKRWEWLQHAVHVCATVLYKWHLVQRVRGLEFIRRARASCRSRVLRA